jgi:hypothetical protein
MITSPQLRAHSILCDAPSLRWNTWSSLVVETGATTECVKSKSGEVCAVSAVSAVSEDEAITFSVAAVDEDGDVIDGEIVISGHPFSVTPHIYGGTHGRHGV